MEFLTGFDISSLIRASGYLGVTLIVFAESGLFFGFFLPGDSLLFTAGFLASLGYFNIFLLVILFAGAAIGGDSFGYFFGRKIGAKFFTREKSFFFRPKYVAHTRRFYERHGKKTIIIARFVPVVRTLAPICAGIGSMHYSTFLAYNIIGGIFWTAGITGLGFLLGSAIPNADSYLLPIILVIIFVSLLPGVIHIIRERR